jgi:hypothetical protein
MRLLALFTLLLLSTRASAMDGFAGTEDFTDFAPQASEDVTHVEESFLYFEKDQLLTVATGFDSFTGPLGTGLGKAFPVLDLRLAHFFDFRRAVELRIGNSRFTGAMTDPLLAALGLQSMRDILDPSNNFFEVHFVRLGAGFKYYTKNDSPENWGMDDRTVWTPNSYFIGGLNYARFAISMPATQMSESLDVIVPHVGIGTDFFIRVPGGGQVKRPPTFSVEASYMMIGTFLKIAGFQNTAGNPSIGDMLSLRTGVNFVF